MRHWSIFKSCWNTPLLWKCVWIKQCRSELANSTLTKSLRLVYCRQAVSEEVLNSQEVWERFKRECVPKTNLQLPDCFCIKMNGTAGLCFLVTVVVLLQRCPAELTLSLPRNCITDAVTSQVSRKGRADQTYCLGNFVWRENTWKLKLVSEEVQRRPIGRLKTLCQWRHMTACGQRMGFIPCICSCTLTTVSITYGERIACVTVKMVLLPRLMGNHTPSSEVEDPSPFLDGGCCYARSFTIMTADGPHITMQRFTTF